MGINKSWIQRSRQQCIAFMSFHTGVGNSSYMQRLVKGDFRRVFHAAVGKRLVFFHVKVGTDILFF